MLNRWSNKIMLLFLTYYVSHLPCLQLNFNAKSFPIKFGIKVVQMDFCFYQATWSRGLITLSWSKQQYQPIYLCKSLPTDTKGNWCWLEIFCCDTYTDFVLDTNSYNTCIVVGDCQFSCRFMVPLGTPWALTNKNWSLLNY